MLVPAARRSQASLSHTVFDVACVCRFGSRTSPRTGREIAKVERGFRKRLPSTSSRLQTQKRPNSTVLTEHLMCWAQPHPHVQLNIAPTSAAAAPPPPPPTTTTTTTTTTAKGHLALQLQRRQRRWRQRQPWQPLPPRTSVTRTSQGKYIHALLTSRCPESSMQQTLCPSFLAFL